LLLSSDEGLFEITDKGVRAVKAPILSILPEQGIGVVMDWKESNVVLLPTEAGLLVIDKNLNIAMIAGIGKDKSRNIAFVGSNPKPGDMIISGKDSLLLLVDKDHDNAAVCKQN
jgi:hypothetical protein